jgi:hypothetical protein
VKLLELVSPIEVVYQIEAHGETVDAYFEIRRDSEMGFWYSVMFFRPGCAQLYRRSFMSADLQHALALKCELIFEKHLRAFKNEIYEQLNLYTA